MSWFVLLCNVTFINIILSGDNALAISMAASKLPQPVRKKAVLIGTVVAILSLILFIAAGTYIIKLPMVKSVAGLMLMFIAIKLTKDQLTFSTAEASSESPPSSGLYRAIALIIVADLGMSLDNAIAMVGVSNGRIGVLLVGLLISIPILVVASHFIAKLMEKLPWIIYAASAYIAWIAGSMVSEDPIWQSTPIVSALHWVAPLTAILIFIAVLLGFILRRAGRLRGTKIPLALHQVEESQ